MKLRLERKYLKDTYTIGKLYIDYTYFCDTIEDKVRGLAEPKVYGETAIPYGIYEVEVTYSPKFKRELPLIKNVPFFEGIRIHKGNTAEDSSGCIIVGENKVKGKVINSTKYEESLVKILKETKEKIIIEIV